MLIFNRTDDFLRYSRVRAARRLGELYLEDEGIKELVEARSDKNFADVSKFRVIEDSRSLMTFRCVLVHSDLPNFVATSTYKGYAKSYHLKMKGLDSK